MTHTTEIYHNLDSRFMGYTPADRLELVHIFTTEKPLTPEQAFFICNVGDDPDFASGLTLELGREYRAGGNRSLSVGDVVRDANGDHWACDSLGWRHVDGFTFTV